MRVSEASSAEFVIDDVKVKVEAVEIEADPHQLCATLAAIRIVQPEDIQPGEVAGPSGTAYRTQALRRIPTNQLGPSDPP